MKVLYLPLYALLYLLSLLPMRVLYIISDLFFFPLYYVIRYRRKMVEKQLADSFPEKSPQERKHIETRFYHFLCDLVVEYVKLITMSADEMKKRVQFPGYDQATKDIKAQHKNFCFFYLGHYCNWEWLASYAIWTDPEWEAAQIYHPLRNATIDQFMLRIRAKFGGKCVPMKETLRHILTIRRNQGHECMAFIADQSPKWEAMHHWTRFLNHDTSFFIGTEKIGKQVDAAIYYVCVSRPKRGCYVGEVIPIAMHPAEHADYTITDKYAELLEQQIREHPELWLWTHNRWKRTREEWERRRQSAE